MKNGIRNGCCPAGNIKINAHVEVVSDFIAFFDLEMRIRFESQTSEASSTQSA